MSQLPITPEDFERLVYEQIPMSRSMRFKVERLEAGEADLRLFFDEHMVRPGGTIAGPVMMTLADTALYAAVMTRVGLEPMAVTSNLSFNFLRRPDPIDLIARARLLRCGRRGAFGEILIHSEGQPEPVCHATGSYVIISPGNGVGQK